MITAVDRATWSGSWVSSHLPARLTENAQDTVGLALRRNPRRAHLLVSGVLGKHFPADPRRVLAAGHRLGHLVEEQLHGLGWERPGLVIGYAETATALGHCVADVLDVPCLQSTRRCVPGFAAAAEFTEDHSHAPGHLLLPADPDLLRASGPIVLVDDEISTGNTVANTVRVLHELSPRRRYLVAALLNTASPAGLDAVATELGVEISLVAGTHATIDVPSDAAERGLELADRYGEAALTADREPEVTWLETDWPQGLAETARHGFYPDDRRRLGRELAAIARRIPDAGRLLVLGTEELMYIPLRLAAALPGPVLFSGTTRSPAVPIDRPGYAIRNALEFAAPEGDGTRYAYNLGGLRVDAVLVVVDGAAGRPGGLVRALGAVSDRVLVATVGES